MTTQEQENFYRHSTGIVDEAKDSFLHLLDFHLTNQGITLQRFIEINGHHIYHLCFNRYPCCQCPRGRGTRTITRGSRVLHPPQLDKLFDKAGSKLPGHNPRSSSAPHCCCPENPNLQLNDLDFTLARFLLVNFTPLRTVERNALDNLVKIRNESYGHAKEARMSNCKYKKSMSEMKKSLLVLAKIYGKEAETKQRLRDIAKQPYNQAICQQLQCTLLDRCDIVEKLDKLLAEKELPDCLTKDLCDITVTEGCEAHFEIWTKEFGVSSLWLHDGVEIVRSKNCIAEQDGKIHSLHIRNTVIANKGIYTVMIKDIERHACLDVKEYFTKNLHSMECIEGETAEFTCEVIEYSLPARWNKNEIQLKNDGKYEILHAGKTHILSIKNCDQHDTSNYTVSINNRVRAASLVVKEYFTKPLGAMTCIEGEPVQFECEVLDDNQAAQWFKNGTELSPSDRFKVKIQGRLHKLVVTNTRLEDKGEYSVKIKNCVRHSQLIVQEIPTAIQILSEKDKELYKNIIKSGTEIRRYIKIVLIGENGVGKTCLLRRLLKQSIVGVQSTDGIDIHRCKINLTDSQWVFDEVSDKKKELLTRIKMASQSNIVEDKTLQDKADSVNFSGLNDYDFSENSKNESPSTSQVRSVRERKTSHNTQNADSVSKSKKRKSKNQSFAAVPNLEVQVASHSHPINKLLTDKILQGLDDLLDNIENVNVPADKFVECGILDFAGEKDYYATHPIFLNPNALHLLVANIMKVVKPITAEDGFDKIGEYLDFWLDTIHSCGIMEETEEKTKTEFLYPPAIIVCTRIDECRDHLHERKEDFRKQLLSVLRNETKKKHIRDICYLSNTESDENDFHVLRDLIFRYGKQLKTFAEKLPLRWIRLEQSLDVLREAELNILSWPDIVELSTKCSIESEDEIKLFLKYQHKVGGIIYFESLKEFIILNQKWLANAFRCLVSDKFDTNLKMTDEWKALEDTGKLEHSLIVKLFDKEPQLDFNTHSGHLLNVMEIFGIIVKLTTLMENGQRQILPTYYMPCMISEKASVTDIVDRFNAKKDNCKRTPWLCIEFDFMPFDFFNHILCYYINKYAICTEPQTGRMAIYHGMGVFFFDSARFVKFFLCFCKNTIALQIWQWKNVEKGTCKAMLEELKLTIERVTEKFETRKVSYTVKSKCTDGNIHIPAGRHSYSQLVNLGSEYFCEEHSDGHNTQNFFQTWFEDYTEDEAYVPAAQLKLKGQEGSEDTRFKQKSIAGSQTTLKEGPSKEGSQGHEPYEGTFKEHEKPAPAGGSQMTEYEMVKKTHAILDEYLHLLDIKEAVACVEELSASPFIHLFVVECINQVLDRSRQARHQTSYLFRELVKKSLITGEQYLQGLNSVLMYAEDMEIDIPNIWRYFAELIGPMVQDGSVPLIFLKEACQILKESGKAGNLVAEILHDASDREGKTKVGNLWRNSGLQWSDFVPEDQVEQFLIDKKLDFTVIDGSQLSTPKVRMPIERIQAHLHDLVVEKQVRNEELFDWIEANLDDVTTKDRKFIRALMTAVCSTAIIGRGNSAKVNATRINERGVILQKYLDHQAEFELQALYALQALVHKLEHPPGVLRTIFDTLYDEDIISEDAFNQWEVSKDPAEQEGKGVAMKQVVQFFTWLREADDEPDS